jgi:hypothetical protein
MMSVTQFAELVYLVPVYETAATDVAFVNAPVPVSLKFAPSLHSILADAGVPPVDVATVVTAVLLPGDVGIVALPDLNANMTTKSFVATADNVQLVAVAEHCPCLEIEVDFGLNDAIDVAGTFIAPKLHVGFTAAAEP